MKRSLLLGFFFLALTACSRDEPSEETTKQSEDSPALKVGDPAPPLTVTKWLNGEPVPQFERGQVYVLEFWATWCGPCIEVMPHLSELQAEYRDQGVTIIGITTTDERNPADRVEQFVARGGPKLTYRFAMCTTPETYEAYMKAARRSGIPCSFIVDQDGKITFIGHPMQLADVLPRVLKRTWNEKTDLAGIQKTSRELGAIFERARRDPKGGLEELVRFEASHPDKANQPDFRASKLILLFQSRQIEEAKTLSESLLPRLVQIRSTRLLNTLRSLWSDEKLNPDRKHVDFAMKAAEAIVAIDGDTDPFAILGLADANYAVGNKEKAVELATKAVKLADKDELKVQIAERIKKYQAEGKK